MELKIDPWNLWKQGYEMVEKSYTDTIQSKMEEQTFSAWIGACQQWYLFFQDYQNKLAKQWLESAKVASTEDVAKVSTLVIQVEEKLECLEDKLDQDIYTELREIRKVLEEIRRNPM